MTCIKCKTFPIPEKSGQDMKSSSAVDVQYKCYHVTISKWSAFNRDWTFALFFFNKYFRWPLNEFGAKYIQRRTIWIVCAQCLVCVRMVAVAVVVMRSYCVNMCLGITMWYVLHTMNSVYTQTHADTHCSCFWNFLHNFLFNELNKYLQSQMYFFGLLLLLLLVVI